MLGQIDTVGSDIQYLIGKTLLGLIDIVDRIDSVRSDRQC